MSKNKTLQEVATILHALTCEEKSFMLLTLSSFSTAHVNVYDHTTLKAPSCCLITEVKQCWAGLVLWWVTTWESPVL